MSSDDHINNPLFVVKDSDHKLLVDTSFLNNMTLRDYFAGQVLVSGYYANGAGFVSKKAYEIADAMIEERSRNEQKD